MVLKAVKKERRPFIALSLALSLWERENPYNPPMLNPQTLKALVPLTRELARHGDDAWALYQAKDGVVATVRSRTQALDTVPSVQGVVFTLRRGNHLYEGATARLTGESLHDTVQQLIRHVTHLDGKRRAKPLHNGPVKKEHFQQEGSLQDVNPATLLKKASAAGKRVAKLDPRIVEHVVRLGLHEAHEAFASPTGLKTQKLVRSEHVLFLIFKDGDKQSEIFGGGSVAGLKGLTITRGLPAQLVKDGVALLDAKRLKPGAYRCILSPAVAGMLAHEAFGHGMEADMFVRERGRGAHFLDQPIAGPLVTMVDSPALPGQAASFFFDHEGRPATHTNIIESGTLKAPISDKISAQRLGIGGSSNGRRETVFNKVYTRMTNTYFDRGPHTLDQMMTSVQNGLYIDYATNGMEDPKGWGIQVEALMAREIKGGRFTGKVFSPVILTGYVPDILKSIHMVGDDLTISGLGFCGKGHKEWVKVTDGGPHIACTARIA